MKIDIIREMRQLAMILTLPVAALAVTVEPLPLSEYADTEVSTNIAFTVDRSIMTRIEFTVALEATPTNNVEVAIGTDENGDGNLSVEESAYVFGYDCGKWFVRDQSKSRVEVEERSLLTCAPRIVPPSELASLGGYSLTSGETHRASACLRQLGFASADMLPRWASHTFILKMRKLDTAWNLVKVTRRGCGVACELVKAEGRKPGLILEVR